MPTAVQSISINVLQDLENLSSLKALLSSQQGAIFSIIGEIVDFAAQPVSAAAAAKANATIALSAPASWTLPNGIVFSLSSAASCAISIDTLSESIDVAPSIDADHTTTLSAGPTNGIAYINIDLDFSIKGTAAGGGAVGALGISGSLSGGTSATLSFCQPVDATLPTEDAIKLALSQIVFPLDPTRIRSMQTGALAHVVFDGTFSAELDVTYGLGDHVFSAPGIASTLNSAQKVVSITPPSVAISSGVNASISYSHTDHFSLIVDKTSDTLATVTLARALASDAGLSAGFKMGVNVTNVSVSIDNNALQQTVQSITGSNALATDVVNAASQPLNNLVNGINAKLAGWATNVSGDIGLTASLTHQTNRAILFNFEADLTDANLTQASWSALVSGDLQQALHAGGLTLQPGSGVSDSLKRSATLHFQFFNLFAFDQVTDFFQNASSELGPDGTIRLHARIGQEQSDTTKTTLSAVRIYFVVTANQNSVNTLKVDDIDLRIELIEANRPGKGSTFEETLMLTPGSPAIADAQDKINRFIGGFGASKLTLTYDIQPSAYRRLSFTPFGSNGRPSPLPQAADQANWTAFRNAATSLHVAPNSVANLTFGDWVNFNRAAVDEIGSTMNPDRSQLGNVVNGQLTLPDNGERPLAAYFLQASQGFMNLIADLATLATQTSEASDSSDYDGLLKLLANIVNQDVLVDYLVPIAGALLHQSSLPGTNVAVAINQASDNSALNCTLTLT